MAIARHFRAHLPSHFAPLCNLARLRRSLSTSLNNETSTSFLSNPLPVDSFNRTPLPRSRRDEPIQSRFPGETTSRGFPPILEETHFNLSKTHKFHNNGSFRRLPHHADDTHKANSSEIAPISANSSASGSFSPFDPRLVHDEVHFEQSLMEMEEAAAIGSSHRDCDLEEVEEELLIGHKRPISRVFNGLSPDIATEVFDFVVRANEEWTCDIRRLNFKVTPPLRVEQVVIILSMLAEKEGPKTALSFFNWSVAQSEYIGFLRLYITMAGFLVSSRCFERAQEILRCMVKNFAVLGRLKESVDMVLEMKNQGLRLDVNTLNCIVKTGYEMELGDLIEYAFVEFVERNGVVPNPCTYKTMVSWYCKIGRLGDAERTFRKMIDKKISFDNVTCTIAIDAYSAKGCSGRVVDFIRKMENFGFSMNTINYTALINGLCKKGSVRQAFETLEEMVRRGLKPNVYTHTVLIDGLCKKGWIEKAFRLFLDLVRSNRYKPNVNTYSVMIGGYCRVGKTRRAEMLLKRMQEQGLVPNIVTYSTLIDGHSKGGNLNRGMELLNEMFIKGCTPNMYAYNAIANGLFKTGKVDEAHKMLDLAVRRGLKFDKCTYTMLIGEDCKRSKTEQALVTFKEMVKAGCQPDMHAYTTLIAAFCKKLKVREAERLLSEAVGMGLVPTKQTYTSMISGYCKEGNVQLAVEMFKKVKRNGSFLDSMTYSAMISGLCKSARSEEARKLFEEQIIQGISPCVVSCISLIYGYCAKEDSSVALSLLEKLDKKTCFTTIGVLIRKLSNECRVDMAALLFHKLLDENTHMDATTLSAFTTSCYRCDKYSLAAEVSERLNRNSSL